LGHVVDKTQDLEDVIQALDPLPTAPPISHMAPAPRARSGSGSRFSRVQVEEDVAVTDSVASTSSSRR